MKSHLIDNEHHGLCLKCGKRMATQMKHGFPLRDVCAEDPVFESDGMEDVVIEKFNETA